MVGLGHLNQPFFRGRPAVPVCLCGESLLSARSVEKD